MSKKLTATEALQKMKGNVTAAAKLLGVPRTTLYSRVVSEVIDNPDWRRKDTKARRHKDKAVAEALKNLKAGLPTKDEMLALGDFKILMLDIETAPNVSYTWGLYDQNVALNQLVLPSYTLCFAAKYYGANNTEIVFKSRWSDGEKGMLKEAHRLLSECDAVVTQNGNRFDLPVLNRDFLLHKMNPPAPFKSIDLLQTTRSRFRFASSKLDHVAQQLGVGAKVEHEGFPLWTKVMAGDKDAQERMREYNIQDVLLMEPIYRRYRPWIKGHPNIAAFLNHEDPSCPTCGGDDLQAQGYALLQMKRRARYRCNSCGTWSRERTDRDKSPRVSVAS